jgi:hypothetical protein
MKRQFCLGEAVKKLENGERNFKIKNGRIWRK